jgi:predicted nucleic acid-binding Zn ribbon protein
VPRTRCNACGKKFSADADKCPSCGQLSDKKVNSGLILALMAGGIIVVFILLVLMQ